VLFGTAIGEVVTFEDVNPVPGSVIAEESGGPLMSDPETANTWNTKGAGLLS